MRAGDVLFGALAPDMSIDCIGYSPLTLHKLRGRVLNDLVAFGRAVQTSYRCSLFARRAKSEQQKKELPCCRRRKISNK
jgi:hypothetical protein